MIIGLTGLPSTGKATISKYLVTKHNFIAHVFSDIIKDELVKEGKDNPVRDDYKAKALHLRQMHGDGALAKLLIDKIKVNDPDLSENYVLDGMRTMGEFDEVKKAGGVIWAVTAAQNTRLDWITQRNRNIDTTFTLEKLNELDEKELHSGEKVKGDQTLAQTIENADVTLVNDKGIEDLEMQVEKLIKI